MSNANAEVAIHPILENARALAQEAGLPYAGSVLPADAWALVQGGHAVLVQ